MRGITSTIDIIWTTNNTQVRRVNNVTASIKINFVSIYNDSFIIPSLNLSDIGSVYQCEVLINSITHTRPKAHFTIPIPGMYIHVCISLQYIIILHIYCMMHILMYIYYNIGSSCSASVHDVVFVIDTSGSIGQSLYQQIKELTANITTELIRSCPRSAVGVILFNNNAHIEFNLQAYTDLNALLSAINRLPYSSGGTNTDEALRYLLSTAQNGTLGLRKYSSKVAIIITDGESNNQSATFSAAAALHTSNIFDVFAVGVNGTRPDLTGLKAIASSPEFVFFTSSFYSTGLKLLQDKLLPQLCESN